MNTRANRKAGRSLVLGMLAISAGMVMADDAPLSNWKMAQAPLMTKWASDVSPDHALPDYPRPQMVRKDWMNLNGLWDYAITAPAATTPPVDNAGKILYLADGVA